MRIGGWAAVLVAAGCLAACRVEVQPEDEAARAEQQAPAAAEPEPAARAPESVLDAQAAAMAARAAIATGDWSAAEAEAARLRQLRGPLEDETVWGNIIVRYDRAVDSLAVRVQRRDQAGALQTAEEVEAAVSDMMRRYGGPNDVAGQP